MDRTRIDQPASPSGRSRVVHRMSDGEGPLLLALLAGSWLFLLAVVWVVSRIVSL